MSFRILTVAETDGQSDRMTAVQEQHEWQRGQKAAIHELKITVTVKRDIIVEDRKDGLIQHTIKFPRADLDSLILFLQDVQTFISEEEMIDKLKGSFGTKL